MEVLRSKSTACMTFSLSFANLIVSLEWFSYGLLAQDFFIQVSGRIFIESVDSLGSVAQTQNIYVCLTITLIQCVFNTTYAASLCHIQRETTLYNCTYVLISNLVCA